MPLVELSRLDDVVAQGTPAPPCIVAVFGATGDLNARKIAPALYNLAADGLLHPNTVVLGVARRARSDEQFRNEMREAVEKFSRSGVNAELWNSFAQRWYYHVTHAGEQAEYRTLRRRMDELDRRHNTGGSRLFYLAMTPDTFGPIAANLREVGLSEGASGGSFVRVVVEKPFGRDLLTAHALNEELLRGFHEKQIFRIDHYLGKETVQNLLVFRFANSIFEPLLNRHYVERVEISTAESAGMEGRRGPYYDQTGALRDMMQNHMLQLLSLIAMDVPTKMGGEPIRDEKLKVLRSLQPMAPHEVAEATVRGQYGPGPDMPGYRQEEGVAPDSQTETFAALRLCIDNWRWAGVPFFLRTGKRLAQKASYITIVFRQEPVRLFYSMDCDLRGTNRLNIRITPNEGITLVCDAKVPGPRMLLRPVKLDFGYQTAFESASPEAYEHLLLDAIAGEPTLFIRNDEVEASWRFVDSIRSAWDAAGAPPLAEYSPLSWGPNQARSLLLDPYKDWQTP